MDILDQEITDYVTLFNNNIKLITSLRRKIKKTLEEEYTEESESVKKLIKSLNEIGLQFKKDFGFEEAEEALKTAQEAALALARLDALESHRKSREEALEFLETVRFLVQDSVDSASITTIDNFINNTEAMQLLVKKGFVWQANMIARNSIEILLRIIVQVDHYKSVNYVPAKRQELQIENKQDLNTYLQNKAKKNKTDFKGLENEAFKIVKKIVKEMFPNNKRILFGSFANTLGLWYGKLCQFAHPELQLKDRHYREALSSWLPNGRLRLKDYPGDIKLMVLMFLCNALAVRLIIELFKNRMKDENYDKNIINVDKAYDDFFEFFKNKENLSLHIPNHNHNQETEKAIQELLEIESTDHNHDQETEKAIQELLEQRLLEIESTERRTSLITRRQANNTEFVRLQIETERSELDRLDGKLRLLSQKKDKEHRAIQRRNKTFGTRNRYL